MDPADLAHLLTEQQRPELADLDLRGTAELVDAHGRRPSPRRRRDRRRRAIASPPRSTPSSNGCERGGRLIYVGAGTAGRLGVLDAAECPPTFNTDRVVGVMAGSAAAHAASARVGRGRCRRRRRRSWRHSPSTPNDAVVGIAASGRTPYTIGAVRHAAALGALTVGISCNPDAELSRHVDHPIELVTGPEVIAGSTRLKAGTAQKIVLNMISTISMVRLGKTFGNLMVDVRRHQRQAARSGPADRRRGHGRRRRGTQRRRSTPRTATSRWRS